jgi:hypothetical protein
MSAIAYFRTFTAQLEKDAAFLRPLQQRIIDEDYSGKYTVKRGVVFNESLDDISAKTRIDIILVGDNPGRREQETGRYLIGPSGKLAENFFRTHPLLDISFRENVLILNKTPLHTPRTADLKKLITLGGDAAARLVMESQARMVSVLKQFFIALSPVKIWVIGYSEMKNGGVFEPYTASLFNELPHDSLFFFRHFSMNQFSIDYAKKRNDWLGGSDWDALDAIGAQYRERTRSLFS